MFERKKSEITCKNVNCQFHDPRRRGCCAIGCGHIGNTCIVKYWIISFKNVLLYSLA